MYEAKSGVKNFSLYWGGGVPRQKFFLPVWTCMKPNLVSKIFPFTRGGGPLTKIFFPVWTCIKPNLVSKIFPFTRGGPSTKIFFPVWTCIKPILVSKFFPFTETGYPSQTCDRVPFLDLRPGTPWPGPGIPLLPGPACGTPPPPGPGTPPPKVNRQTFPSINITFPRTTYAGGKNKKGVCR